MRVRVSSARWRVQSHQQARSRGAATWNIGLSVFASQTAGERFSGAHCSGASGPRDGEVNGERKEEGGIGEERKKERKN